MQPTMQTTPSSSVWQRRTNRLVAAAVIVIGLTMMISNITQCIYIGMLFIIVALVWLAWLTMKERKLEPPRPEDQPSPVLFLVTSHILPRSNRPTLANPTDKPPSYDQILSLDGLPPDYSSVLTEKPPRYEDVGSIYNNSTTSSGRTTCVTGGTLPTTSSGGTTGVTVATLHEEKGLGPSTGAGGSQEVTKPLQSVTTRLERLKNGVVAAACSFGGGNEGRGASGSRWDTQRSNKSQAASKQYGQPRSSNSLPRSEQPVEQNRKRHSSSGGGYEPDSTCSSPSKVGLLRLQVPTLPADTAGTSTRYIDSSSVNPSNNYEETNIKAEPDQSHRFINPPTLQEHNERDPRLEVRKDAEVSADACV